MDFLGIGPMEILLVLIIALIFLGPGRIVDFSRTLGKWIRAVRKAGNEFTAAVTREVEKAGKEPPTPTVEEETLPEELNNSQDDHVTKPDGERQS